MTNSGDALNAFSGILQNLEKKYGGEFFCGLPVPEFQWGLLWRYQSPPKQRFGFPTWSWAGWEGALRQVFPFNPRKPHQFQPHLYIWKALQDQLVQLFRSSLDIDGDMKELEILFRDDPVTKIAQFNSQDPEFDICKYPKAQEAEYIFVEAIVFQFIPDYSRPLTGVREMGEDERFGISIRGTACEIKIMSRDPEVDGSTRQTGQQQFLLLARDRREGWMYHHLLLLQFQENVAMRCTTLELIVPEDHLEVLEELEPRKRRVVLS
jgi:hypothetical protein